MAQARTRLVVRTERMRRERRRKALHLQRDERADPARRRGHHPRPILGELPGYREVCGRNVDIRGDDAGRWLYREGSLDRKSYHSEDAVTGPEFAEQSHGRRG